MPHANTRRATQELDASEEAGHRSVLNLLSWKLTTEGMLEQLHRTWSETVFQCNRMRGNREAPMVSLPTFPDFRVRAYYITLLECVRWNLEIVKTFCPALCVATFATFAYLLPHTYLSTYPLVLPSTLRH